jgi:hypothetical protein
MNHDPYIVKPGDQISLIKDYNPGYRCEFHPKTDAIKKLKTFLIF